MATNNAINNTVLTEELLTTAITVDPGASGDSYIQFNINTTGEFRMGVDDTDDSFRISQGSALGTNDTFVMTSSGGRTLPLQSAFFAVPSGVQSNVTGDATIYTVLFQTESFDQNGDFNGSTGIFTAPIAGKYHFIVSLSFTGITSSHTNCPLYFWKNGANTTNVYMQPNFSGGGDVSGAFTWCGEYIIELAASDTVQAIARFIGGTKVVDVTTSSYLGGYLITG